MMKIELSRGAFAMIDDEDFADVAGRSWCLSATGYAVSNSVKPNGKRTMVYMHRQLTRAGLGDYVDHIDGNKLNNQKSNLRLCSQRENMRNSGKHKNNTSGFKGVTFDKARRKWKAHIRGGLGVINLGRFNTPEEAARAYDAAAKELHGEFSYKARAHQ